MSISSTDPPAGDRFRQSYYAPNNAVGALVATSIRLSPTPPGRTSAGSPRPAPAAAGTEEPPQRGERRITVEFDAEPQVMIAFHKPSWPDPDEPVFQVIDSLLTSGRPRGSSGGWFLETQVARTSTRSRRRAIASPTSSS